MAIYNADWGFPATLGYANPLFTGYDDFFSPFIPTEKRACCAMHTDITETSTQYKLEIDLPGYKRDNIAVDVEDGYLTVTAGQNACDCGKDCDEGSNETADSRELRYLRRERRLAECSRKYYIGDVDENAVSAHFSDGTLTVTIPKKDNPRPRKTHVQIV